MEYAEYDESDDDVDDAEDIGDDDDSADLAECPNCRALIYEQAEQCPRCGAYMSPAGSAVRVPVWVWGVAMVCLFIIV